MFALSGHTEHSVDWTINSSFGTIFANGLLLNCVTHGRCQSYRATIISARYVCVECKELFLCVINEQPLFDLCPYGWGLIFPDYIGNWSELIITEKHKEGERFILPIQSMFKTLPSEVQVTFYTQRVTVVSSFREDPDAFSIIWRNTLLLELCRHCIDYPLLPGWRFLSKLFHSSRSYIPHFLTVESGKMRQTFLFDWEEGKNLWSLKQPTMEPRIRELIANA